MDRLPRFEVRLGRLARRGPDARGRYIFEQKGVDVNLSIDLVHLATKGKLSDAVIVGGDFDFVPAIQMAKAESISIWLVHGDRFHNSLWEIADERLRIDRALLDICKRDR